MAEVKTVAVDYKKAMEEAKAERLASGLEGRMDDDRALVELSKYSLLDVNGADVPNAISITLNDPGVFATNVESALGNAVEQIAVETEDKNLDTAYIEDVVKAAFAAADKRRTRIGKWALNPFLDQQMCRRGRGVARVLFRLDPKTKVLIPDIKAWDSRRFYFKMGEEDFEWGGYESTRTVGKLRAQYPKADIPGLDDEEVLVWEILDKEKQYLWVNEIEAFNQVYPIPYGRVPIAYQVVPMGSSMSDKESKVHEGESIFFLIRDLLPELNRLVSIIQTLNSKAVDDAMLWKSEKGETGAPPKFRALTKPGSMTAAELLGGAELVPYGELKRQAYLLHTMIETRIQRGSLSNLDLGIMGNQPWSAVALMEIGEGRDQVFLPRLGARGSLKQQIAEMFIEQMILIGKSTIEIGARGHQRSFQKSKLLGAYEVGFKYFIKSPKTDAARFSMAVAAGNLISEKSKRRDILQREDSDEDERWLRWEEMELLVPAVKMRRGIKALLEMAERGDKDAEAEAKLVLDTLGMTVEQTLSGNSEQIPATEKPKQPTPLVSMFGKGGSSSSQKAGNLQAQEREGGD